MKQEMKYIKMRKSCINCIHREICTIYLETKNTINSLQIKMKPSTIADVCPYYMNRWEVIENEKQN